MADLALATRDLSKHFGDLVALDGLDVEVAAGEVFGFLGPNGAGKTTTIRLLLDFLRPTRGSAEVLGRSPGDVVLRRDLGYLPADLHLDPRYRAADVLSLHADLRGGIDETFRDELLERFGLDPSRPVGELSTGNRRKIGIVQAFVHRPRLVILDEPTSGLDPLLQQEFLALVREAVGDGAAVFFSSHVLPEVEHVADRVGILREGRLVAVAGVAELRARARQRLELHLAEPGGEDSFRGVPGVVDVAVMPGVAGPVVRLVVEGSVDAVVKAAARLPVARIVTHRADLEEVFLDYYRGGS